MNKVTALACIPCIPCEDREDELHLKLFNAQSDSRRFRELSGRLSRELDAMRKNEARKVALRKLSVLLVLKILLLMAFGFGCTISAIACVLYGIWWAAIAPGAFLLYGLWKVGKKGL